MEIINLCIVGDSLSYGAWDPSGGWVGRLRSYLHGTTLATRFQSYYFAYHLGIPGNTTGDKLFSLVRDFLLQHNLIETGGAPCCGQSH